MAEITKDLGIATAYGYALSKGYTGTEEEFAQLLKDVADGAGNVEAWADGTINGEPVPEDAPQYHNNSKYYSEQSDASAQESSGYANDAKGYANDASGYANDASGYANNASGHANTASGYADNASDSADAAALSASQAAAAASAAVGSPLVAATVADMTDTTKIYVYVGSEAGYTAGDWYYWDGVAWTDGGIYNSAAVQTDTTLSVAGMAADAKAAGDAIGANSSDITDLKSALSHTIGYLVSHTTSGSGSTVSEDIPVSIKRGQTYIIDVVLTILTSTFSLKSIDSVFDPTVIDDIHSGSYNGEIAFTATADADYIRYTSASNATITVSAVTPTSNYDAHTHDMAELNRHLLTDVNITPLFVPGKYISLGNVGIGNAIDPAGTSNSQVDSIVYPISLMDEFILTGTGVSNNIRLWAFCDSSYKIIAMANNGATATDLTLTNIYADGYLVVNCYNVNTYKLIKKNAAYLTDSIPGLVAFKDSAEINKADIELTGIDMFGSIGCIGDSFTVGGVRNSTDTGWLSAKNSYPKVLQNRHTIPVTNFGASGTTTKTYNENNLATVLADTAKDVYLICLGLNDAWNGMTIGSVSDIHDDDYTQNPDTFYGNYGRIISRMLAGFPTSRLVIITPWRISGIFAPFADACAGIAEHFNLPYLDCREEVFFNSSLWENTLVSSHPTQVTYTGMAYAVERMMAKCIVENEEYFRYAGLEPV